MSAIVLCGGNINYNNLPIGTANSNSMISINGKPVIGWILDDLLEKGIMDIIVVLQKKNARLYDYISWSYEGRGNVSFSFVKENGNILDSLLEGLNDAPAEDPVHIILGDTLIQDSYSFSKDTVYTGTYENPENWCLVKTDSQKRITDFYDKQEIIQENCRAIAGYYYIKHTEFLKDCVIQSITNGNRELSKSLELYNNKHPIETCEVTTWYDFGHLDHLIAAKRELLQSRFFNRLQIDEKRGVITKTSTYDEKLKDELNWYKLIPPELRILTPRLIEEIEKNDNTIQISQELYGYPNLAELYVLGDLDVSIWKRAIDKLLEVHSLFTEHKIPASATDAADVYINKTQTRLNKFFENNQTFAEITKHDFISLNHKKVRNVNMLLKELEPNIKRLTEIDQFTIIHGDYCFSNILYDIQTEIVRLIDPRGSFGSKGAYGDPRYDMAKLRHSICGLYDNILTDLFKTGQSGDEFTLEVYQTPTNSTLGTYFDQKLEEYNYRVDEIKLIEGLLFLSMLPLHEGKPQRQLAMYLTGIKTLNQLI